MQQLQQENIQILFKRRKGKPWKNKFQEKQEFYCPSSDFLNHIFTSVPQVLSAIQDLDKNKYFKKKTRGKYNYLICRFCQAKISFILDSGQIKFYRLNNFHVHAKQKFKKLEEERIMEIILSSSNLESPEKMKTEILNILPISKNRLNYIMRKILDKNSLGQANNLLSKLNYYVKVKQSTTDQELPEIILIMSPAMKKWVTKYSDCFSFDITYNILRNRTHDGRQWGVGTFTTFDSNLRIIPVAYAILCKQDSQSFDLLFKGFLQMAQTNNCTFLTDDQKAIRSGLQILQKQGIYHGIHVLDDFHILRNLRKRVAEDEFYIYHSLICAQSPKKYSEAFERLSEFTQTPSILKSIHQNRQRMCFSQIKSKFIGLRLTTSRNQKFNDLLKKMIPKQTNIYRLILSLKNFENRVEKYKEKFESKEYQLIFQDFRLKQLRDSIQQKIFRKFLVNYIRGLKLFPKKLEDYDEMYQVQDILTSGDDCYCGSSIKCGIPCYHMLCVLIRKDCKSFLQYFHRRWQVIMPKQLTFFKTYRNSRRRRT